MTDFERERIENWVGDFVHGEAARGFSAGTREYAATILADLLERAVRVRGRAADDLDKADLSPAFAVVAGGTGLPGSVAAEVPDLCAAFLADLQTRGRLADGRRIGLELRASGGVRRRDAEGRLRPERRPGDKVPLNGPCPCGSGRKFKKCCHVPDFG